MDFAFNILALVVLIVGIVILLWGISDLVGGSLIVGIVLIVVGLIIMGWAVGGMGISQSGRGHIDP